MSFFSRDAAIAAVVSFAMVSHASAISFVLNFDDTNSLTPDFDSDGSQLTAIMEAATDYWEDVILDTQTINITYFWDDLNDPSIGNHNGTAFSGSVETGMTLRFDTQNNAGTARNWYFDPDPTTNDEFDFQTGLYRDLNAINQVGGTTPWYGGTPQDYFEVSVRGTWADTNQGIDLYSVALHEIGHGLGMTGSNPASVTETVDLDYDLPTALTDGQTISITTANATANGRAHIAPTNALMFTGNQAGRTYPSYSDVYAMASVSGWSQIDLPRKYFAGGPTFNNAGNWLGGRLPDSGDDVFILSDDAVMLTATTFLNSLTIEEGNSLNVDDEILFTFTDLNLTARPGAAGGNPTLNAGASGLVSVNRDMNVAGGNIFLNGNEVAIGNDLNFSDVDARTPTVFGHGELRVFNQINGLTNFFATGSQTLEVIASGPSQSIEIGRLVAATTGHITFTDFDGVDLQPGAQLVIGPNRTMTISNLTANSINANNLPDLDFNGTPGNPTTLVLTGSGGYIEADVDVSGFAYVQGTQVWGFDAEVNVADPNDRLILDGPTEFAGATFSGDGVLVPRNDLLVTANTTVGTKYFDWDGDGGTPLNTLVTTSDRLTINSSQINPIGFDNGYDGVATVFGTLTVNTYLEVIIDILGNTIQVPDRWRLNSAGIISLNSSSDFFGSGVLGSGVEVFGTVEAFGELSNFDNMALEPGGIVNVNDSTAELRLYDETRLRGGTILGLGTLTNRGQIYVDANMSIDTQAFHWSETPFAEIIIGDNHTLTINAPTLNENNDPHEGVIHVGVDATLTVNSSGISEWGNIGTIDLDGGQINGKPVHNMSGGVIEGNGLIFGTTFTNDGTIRPYNEGLIRIHTTGTPDLDGVNNNGHIDVTDGDFFAKSLTPFGPVPLEFYGTVAIDNGFSFAINSSIDFFLYGEIDSEGGAVDVVHFTNIGTVRGDTEFYNDYVQHPAGTLSLELGGTTTGSYDRLYSDLNALLAGTLQIDFAPGYVPTVGDSFNIITANAVLGNFSSILAPTGFVFDLTFPDPGNALLTLIQIGSPLLGDLDGDGFVGIDDLNLVLANWNQDVPPANPLADPSGDGFVGIDDLNTVLGNWNAGTPPQLPGSNIPEPGSFVILGGLVMGLSRRTR